MKKILLFSLLISGHYISTDQPTFLTAEEKAQKLDAFKEDILCYYLYEWMQQKNIIIPKIEKLFNSHKCSDKHIIQLFEIMKTYYDSDFAHAKDADLTRQQLKTKERAQEAAIELSYSLLTKKKQLGLSNEELNEISLAVVNTRIIPELVK